jgi:hypothetical protein
MMISLERKDRAPQLLHQRGIARSTRGSILDRYFSAGYLLDPFCLAVEMGLAQGFYHLEEIAPDNFFDSDYYKSYYLKAGCSKTATTSSIRATTPRSPSACSRVSGVNACGSSS